jgi:hypothetical protein
MPSRLLRHYKCRSSEDRQQQEQRLTYSWDCAARRQAAARAKVNKLAGTKPSRSPRDCDVISRLWCQSRAIVLSVICNVEGSSQPTPLHSVCLFVQRSMFCREGEPCFLLFEMRLFRNVSCFSIEWNC